jgi:hypothetical protein
LLGSGLPRGGLGPSFDSAQQVPASDRAHRARGWTTTSRCTRARATGSSTTPTQRDATPLLIFLAKISGTRYHEPSAQDARRRIAAFFGQHLPN